MAFVGDYTEMFI